MSDDENVISKNLKYILHKDGDIWYLLANSIHSSGFRDYYKLVMREANHVGFGVTTMETDRHLNLQRILQNYCDAFRVKNGTSWLDPTCNLFYSDEMCRRSALFGDNKVEYPQNLIRAASSSLAKLGNQEAGVAPLCTCFGNPVTYMTQNAPQDSFVREFQRGGRRCPTELSVETNSLILEAQKIKIEESSLQVGEGDNSLIPPPSDPSDPTPPPRPAAQLVPFQLFRPHTSPRSVAGLAPIQLFRPHTSPRPAAQLYPSPQRCESTRRQITHPSCNTEDLG